MHHNMYYCAVIGALDRKPPHGFVALLQTGDNPAANYIMALFCETLFDKGFAIFYIRKLIVSFFVP